MIRGIYGINIAVKDLEAATKKYEDFLGVVAEPMGADSFAFPGLAGARLDVGGVMLHLISPVDDSTAVAKFIESRGEGLFLLSLRVDDIDGDVVEARHKGLNVLLPESARGDFGAANFIHPKSMCGVQVELYQPQT
ncbi:MAG: VOC family protein [Actinobacteria bacterium]|nr:VOC family protein [Actinomycetota bacterium]